MKRLSVALVSLLLSYLGVSADMREEAILDRVSSIASICLKTDDCGIIVWQLNLLPLPIK